MATITYTDESSWLSMFDAVPRLRWDQLDLNRQALPLYAADGFNIPDKHRPEMWQWQPGDALTLKWRPQGITGSREAGAPKRKRFFAISWYGREQEDYAQRGARISLVNYEAGSSEFLQYRHVLLVQDVANRDRADMFRLPADAPAYTQYGGFAPVPIHAGGVAWVGDRLYVSDTRLGLRVFDLSRLYEVRADPNKSRCGNNAGNMYAFDYRYVLPEIGYYCTQGTAPNSFVSVGTGKNGRCLWAGQYLKKSVDADPILFGWKLTPVGAIDMTVPVETFVPNDKGARVYNIQGAYRAGGATWMSVTARSKYKRSEARLITQAASANGLRWRWPHGTEDLYLEADTNTLWCLTEFSQNESSGERFVFGVDFATYAPELHEDA